MIENLSLLALCLAPLAFMVWMIHSNNRARRELIAAIKRRGHWDVTIYSDGSQTSKWVPGDRPGSPSCAP